jgi:TonB-linked SusC/RagA family outer membrane protein
MGKRTKFKTMLMALAVGLLPLQLAAQQLSISGTVVDGNNEPVVGASVVVKGTTTGVITGTTGNYDITADANAVLVFSMVGMGSREEAVNGRARIDVALSESAQEISDVVVIGYGSVRKSDLTGAVSAVSAKELTMRPVSNALEALQGKAAGVEITTSQRPGELGSVRIRGMRSLEASNDPLYVVDGVVLSAGGIETINPRDIESVSVLKDASSTAIYGSRGANGVILVTTKKGKDGAFKLTYSGTFTSETLKDLQPSMSAADYITWYRWAKYNQDQQAIQGGNPSSGYARGDQPTQANDGQIFGSGHFSTNGARVYENVMKGWEGGTWDASKVTDTDWGSLATQTGITHEHTVSASGGTERLKSYASFGYLDNKGTTKGQEYERYNFNVSTDITPIKWFTMGGSINAAWSIQDYGSQRSNMSPSVNSFPNEFYTAGKRFPNVAMPYDADGNVINLPAGYSMYTIVDEEKYVVDNRQTLRALGNFYASVNFGEMWEPLKGLSSKIAFGPDMQFYRRGLYIDGMAAGRKGASGPGTSSATLENARNFSWVLSNVVSYSKEMDIHKFDVTLLQEASKYDRATSDMSGSQIQKSSYLWNNMSSIRPVTETAKNVSINSGLTQRQVASYGFRGNYTLMDKYLVTVSGRYDGSSVLAKGNKWAFFPSAAVGWRVEQEEFMKSFDFINQLKVRAGIGQTGNSAISPYQTLGEINQYNEIFGVQGDKGISTTVYVPNEPGYNNTATLMANPTLGWEKTTQWNIGLDFSVLKGRVGGSLDVYASSTSDLLMRMRIPTITGYANTMANVGKTKNKGVDISLNLVPVEWQGFVWTSTLNTAWHKDEIVELAYGKQDMVGSNWFIGQPINVFYGYANGGLWQESDAEEMAKFNGKGATFSAGKVKPIDQNGDSIFNEDDYVILGNRNPSWTFGWTNTFSYKGFELGVELYGRFGYMVNTGGQGQGGVNQNQIDYWTPDNTGAK